jgi:hypothetical protein
MEDGDVFFLVSDPATVIERGDVSGFMLLGDEVWRELEHVGTGEPSQRVIVIHNTRKFGMIPAGPAQ